MEKNLRVTIIVLGIWVLGFCIFKIATQPAYNHAQDAAKAAEETQAEKMNKRAMAINELEQPSEILRDTHDGDFYEVVSLVWDENLGTYRIIGERKEDGFLLVLTNKQGSQIKVGQKVKRVAVVYRETSNGGTGIKSSFIPLSDVQANNDKR